MRMVQVFDITLTAYYISFPIPVSSLLLLIIHTIQSIEYIFIIDQTALFPAKVT